MMRYLGLCAVLALAACNSNAGGGAAVEPTEAAPKVASGAPPVDDSAALLAITAQKGRYAPRDECAREAGAETFRRKLAAAVAKGDAAAVSALAVPEVKLGFGGDDGRARFLAKLQDSDGELMAELKQLLPLGCAINADGTLTMPWYFAQDMGDIDGYAATIVTGEDVPLRAKADAGSAVLKRISWDVVKLNDGLYPERAFQLVETADGAKGYMPTAKLRSLLDYRLLADREGGEWKIAAIVAGD